MPAFGTVTGFAAGRGLLFASATDADDGGFGGSFVAVSGGGAGGGGDSTEEGGGGDAGVATPVASAIALLEIDSFDDDWRFTSASAPSAIPTTATPSIALRAIR